MASSLFWTPPLATTVALEIPELLLTEKRGTMDFFPSSAISRTKSVRECDFFNLCLRDDTGIGMIGVGCFNDEPLTLLEDDTV